MYKVIRFFRDIQDNNHAYHVGDTFPHGGMAVTEERLLELSTDSNRRHVPLIEKVKEEPVEDFMNPPEEVKEQPQELPKENPKPRKKRGRPRNDAK